MTSFVENFDVMVVVVVGASRQYWQKGAEFHEREFVGHFGC